MTSENCKTCGEPMRGHWADFNSTCGVCMARGTERVRPALNPPREVPVSWAAVRADAHKETALLKGDPWPALELVDTPRDLSGNDLGFGVCALCGVGKVGGTPLLEGELCPGCVVERDGLVTEIREGGLDPIKANILGKMIERTIRRQVKKGDASRIAMREAKDAVAALRLGATVEEASILAKRRSGRLPGQGQGGEK